jgi:integrase
VGLGVPGVVIAAGLGAGHDLRHTCAAWLVQARAPLTEVRDVLGHSTVKMMERCARLAPENVRAALALLEGGESR